MCVCVCVGVAIVSRLLRDGKRHNRKLCQTAFPFSLSLSHFSLSLGLKSLLIRFPSAAIDNKNMAAAMQHTHITVPKRKLSFVNDSYGIWTELVSKLTIKGGEKSEKKRQIQFAARKVSSLSLPHTLSLSLSLPFAMYPHIYGCLQRQAIKQTLMEAIKHLTSESLRFELGRDKASFDSLLQPNYGQKLLLKAAKQLWLYYVQPIERIINIIPFLFLCYT